MPLAALCIICIVLSLTSLASAAACYNPLGNDSEFFVETSTPITSAYACQLAATSVAYNAGTHTHTFSVGVVGSTISCGEMISTATVSYGYYECAMLPPGIAGTVTSCMVVSTVRTKFESVYIKFLGNETGRVYIGYFSGGIGYQAGPSTLDFDATSKAHRYGFEWTSGYIKWYVDGKEVSSAHGNQPIPSTPNRFIANLLTEDAGIITDDSYIPTDSKVNRVFPSDVVASATATFTNISYTPVIFIACDNSSGIIPGDGGNQYDPMACDMREPYVIYNDALASGWTSPDSTTSDFGSTSNVRTGSKSIFWDVKPNAQLFFVKASTFPSIDYYSIEFWVYGNGYNGQQIGAKMLFNDGDGSIVVNLASVLTEGIQPWDWSRVVIPFSRFGVSPNISQSVRGFVLTALSTEFGGRIGIDNVLLGYQLPMCANTTKVIYSEGVSKGYDDWSWGVYKTKSADVAHTGSYSAQWELYGSSGIRYHNAKSVDAGEFTGVSFWINTAQLAGWNWVVGMTSDTSTLQDTVAGSGPINLFKYYGGNLPQQTGQWTRVVVPFYQFGITSGVKLNGIIFRLGTNQYQGTLYIDDIEYIKQEVTSTSGASATGLGFGLLLVAWAAAMLL